MIEDTDLATTSRSVVAPPVEAVRRALRILRCFSVDRPELGISDIARELGMHKSTVHRLLNTLELEGFIHRVDGSRYALSWTLFELGSAVPAWQGIRSSVLRSLEALADATGETAHLSVLEGGQVLYVEKVESANQLRMPSAVGRLVPVHCTALGKVLLAGLGDDEATRLVRKLPLSRFTPNTITDPATVMGEVREVRETGFAVDREEIEEGLMCIAAPVVDETDFTCAAISIAGPASRILARFDEKVTAVKSTAASLSRDLGPHARSLKEACRPG
jgi:IclR family KDG regulon transcriptional repressor